MEEYFRAIRRLPLGGVVLHSLPLGRMSTFSEQLSDKGWEVRPWTKAGLTWRSSQLRPLTGRNS